MLWLRALLKDIGVPLASTPLLWCDNISAATLTHNPVFHARTKHIEIDAHFIRDQVISHQLAICVLGSTCWHPNQIVISLAISNSLGQTRPSTLSYALFEGGCYDMTICWCTVASIVLWCIYYLLVLTSFIRRRNCNLYLPNPLISWDSTSFNVYLKEMNSSSVVSCSRGLISVTNIYFSSLPFPL